jgi:hypothetical protein
MGDGGSDEIGNPFDVDTELMQHWLPGTATIVSVSRTGHWVGRNEFFEVILEVELEGFDIYEIEQRQLISEKAQFEWQPGIELGILVNPADHAKAVLTEARRPGSARAG